MEFHELSKVRDIALSLPEVNEKSSPGGATSFIILNKTTLCYYHEDHHHDRVLLWCPAYPDLKKDLIRNKPTQYFQPHTSSAGHFGLWLGIYLDSVNENPIDWESYSNNFRGCFSISCTKKLLTPLS